MDIVELSKIMQESGIVGAGGAGFPSYAKLNGKTETLILNCAECEPLLKLHRQLLERYAAEIAATFYRIGQTTGAKEMIIGLKKSYTGTIDALNAVLDEYPGMRLGLLDEVYPAGDEVVLIYELTKKVVQPGGLPIDCGVTVFNVETVYNVYRAVEANIPVVDKLVSGYGAGADRNVHRRYGTSGRQKDASGYGIFCRRPDDGMDWKRFPAGDKDDECRTRTAAGSSDCAKETKEGFD